MKYSALYLMIFFGFVGQYFCGYNNNQNKDIPIAEQGKQLFFNAAESDLPEYVIQTFSLTAGKIEQHGSLSYQWLMLRGYKGNNDSITVFILTSGYPLKDYKNSQSAIARYIVCRSDGKVFEFYNNEDNLAVLPDNGAWHYLFPKNPENQNLFNNEKSKIHLLGHEYQLSNTHLNKSIYLPQNIKRILLTPNLFIGVPHNFKIKNNIRRFDESDYEYIELTENDYKEMVANGLNVFRVNNEQVKWIETENVYYWGVKPEELLYPDCLYLSNYIGPALFFDEPMVVTRDHHIKPRFIEEPDFRREITPEIFVNEFKEVFHNKKYKTGPNLYLEGLKKNANVDVGNMKFLQSNMYTWETMISSAYYQLSEGKAESPGAAVFEPPGRFGAKRVLPELNMSFGCQIPPQSPKNLISIISGFLRGAARLTDKSWGISIYGQVDRSEVGWYLANAYDQGATHFFFWDSYQLAAVPYQEYLMHSKNLRYHSKQHPNRSLDKMKHAAEVAILLPKGYNLGHVKMGIGNFSGLPELNMERKNKYGYKYREIMHNFLIEIERCIRLGIEYDLFWENENLDLDSYNEIVKIKRNGTLSVSDAKGYRILKSPRYPERPDGLPPVIVVSLTRNIIGDRHLFTARTLVSEGTSPVYYTLGADKNGIYNNHYVLWELYGPNEEDYTDFWGERWESRITESNGSAVAEIEFELNEPGNYRLRVSACDITGRSTTVWKAINISKD